MYPLTPVTDLRFTRNHEALISAISKFEGRKFDYEPRNSSRRQYAYYPAPMVERVRNQVTMDALKGAAVRLGGMREGRKSIIFVSEGFTSDPAAAAERSGRGDAGHRQPATAATPNAHAPRATAASSATRPDMLNDMRDVFDMANRQNTSIYAVDPRGLAAFEYDINEGVGLSRTKGLQGDARHPARARGQHGRPRDRQPQRPRRGMKQIIRDASGYYLLGYNSTQAPTDGKFQRSRSGSSGRGVDVRARKGYWAYTAADAARATRPRSRGAHAGHRRPELALRALARPPGALLDWNLPRSGIEDGVASASRPRRPDARLDERRQRTLQLESC